MTTLVTGSRGFLASHLVAELRRRPHGRLVLLDRLPSAGAVSCDLLDAEALRRLMARLSPKLVFHLAGTTGSPSFDELWSLHVRATLNLLEALRPLGLGTRVVLSGSSAEYGTVPAGRPVREDDPTLPLTLYGATKLAQTLAAEPFQRDGLSIVTARIFNAVGPGIPPRLALGAFAEQLAAIERGAHAPTMKVGSLTPRRDFVDVRDVARALSALARPAVAPGVYNVCSGRAVSVGELLRGLIRLVGREVRLEADPALRRRVDLPLMIGSYRKLQAAAGWEPRISLERSLKDTLDWYRARRRG
ncbi:MAG: NAD-dependent epimerase/dehydratase family protein [Elusimicrobiota bacterium]|jgi:GDP-4-dehydro-6-deoxy-D-mannose reductase